MSFDPSWYTTRTPVVEKSDPTLLDSRDKFGKAVNSFALSNADKQAEAISRADSFSFQLANPWFKQTDKNTNLVNKWLNAQGITQPTYPDFAAAADALMAVLDVDRSRKTPTTFKGAITGNTYESVETMIAQERNAALRRVPEITPEEIAFENLPIEEVQARIKDAVRGQMLEANGLQTEKNGHAWVTLHPEYEDTTRNGHLMLAQMRKNGVADGLATIEQYDVAAKQLRDAGLLTVNKNAVANQKAAEIEQLAADYQAIAFDEEAAYSLPLEEVRRRAGLVNR